MTRRWVKEELRKNPVRDIIVKAVNYLRENKNRLYIAAGVVGVLFLFGFVIVRSKIEDNKEASLLYAQAQADFSRFNYKSAVKKLDTIQDKYNNTSIVDQALYLKGQAFYKRGELQKAVTILENILEKYPDSKIKSEVSIMLGGIYENLGKFEAADSIYKTIKSDNYLYPEALSGRARVMLEIGQKERAIDFYKQVQSHYPGTYWGEKAKEMLAFLGVKPQVNPEQIPDLNLR